jgi:hypothetical protein
MGSLVEGEVQLKLVGIAEIAELAGSSRQAIGNLRARDGSFPLPVAELRSGPVFREQDIQNYLASRGRALPPASPVEAVAPEPVKFDPLTPLDLARSVERALLDEPERPLPPSGAVFTGGGVYCIYYHGPYGPYGPIAGLSQTPIYVGKAVQRGAGTGALFQAHGPVLLSRLREHARTVEEAENLQLADFSCRFLITDDIWAPSAEALLIHHFRPLWNTVVVGFGLHSPGAGRSSHGMSAWDQLHPGRSWATRQAPSSPTQAEILKAVEEHLRTIPVPDFSSVPQLQGYRLWPLGCPRNLRSATRQL